MTVSIIIAVKTWQKNLEECVGKCAQLDYPPSGFEILILPDAAIERDSFHSGRVPLRIIPTGPVNPAQKRDIAIEHAKGEILGFIDDDAYPAKDWLNKAMDNFKDSNIAAAGGPAVTPPGDTFRQRASGLVYSSPIVSAKFTYRYLPKKGRYVDDYPSCNFLVRKSIMQQLGGFDTKFWPGEDTKLCLEITKKLRQKIIYDPGALVYHHRRPLFAGHLRQVASYALHRGYFARRYPETSRRSSYFIPSLFLLALVSGGFLSLLSLSPFRIVYLTAMSLYLILVSIFSISKELALIPLVFFGIILTHLTYGFYF
ncbi:MAG: glycosyltransferase, partial [Candidatus Omnitrophota bacterium]|nr:glycosyltransferase [Candidatus Omnitrophota bacterium]